MPQPPDPAPRPSSAPYHRHEWNHTIVPIACRICGTLWDHTSPLVRPSSAPLTKTRHFIACEQCVNCQRGRSACLSPIGTYRADQVDAEVAALRAEIARVTQERMSLDGLEHPLLPKTEIEAKHALFALLKAANWLEAISAVHLQIAQLVDARTAIDGYLKDIIGLHNQLVAAEHAREEAQKTLVALLEGLQRLERRRFGDIAIHGPRAERYISAEALDRAIELAGITTPAAALRAVSAEGAAETK